MTTAPSGAISTLKPRSWSMLLFRAAFVLVAFGGILVAGYAIYAYTAYPLGKLVHPEMRRSFNEHRWLILTHIFGSTFALLLGPMQFSSMLRARWPRLHRISGRIYLIVGVLIGAGAGLFMSFHAFGGMVSKAGFAVGALISLFTGVLAFTTARARRFSAHKEWMIRNYAMALAALTLRIGLGLGIAFRLPFETFYPALAWLAWIPNLLVAELIIRMLRRKPVEHRMPSLSA